MFHRIVVGVAVVSCLMVAPTLVNAQAIGGAVTDTTGAVLPGVTIEVRSPALIEQVRTAVSDGEGQYMIVQLEPGTYTVSFSLPGFSNFVREGIELAGTATASVNGEMQIGSVEETITVTGAAPVVDVQNVAQTAVMTREVVDAVPSGKYFNNLAVLVPGMTVGTTYGVSQDVGGQSGQSSSRLSIHGGDQKDQRLQVDGMAVNTWTQEDGSALWLADGAYEEVQIDHSAVSAETSLGGVRFNMIPRSGGNTLASRTFLNFTTQKLQSNNVGQGLLDQGFPTYEVGGETKPAVNRVEELWSFNPSIGGPIVRDKLWFFGSYTRQVADSYIIFFDDVDPNALTFSQSDTQSIDDQDVHDIVTNFTWQASRNNKFQFNFNDNTVCHCHFLIGQAISINVASSAAVLARFDTQVYRATWTSTLSNRLLFEAGFSAMPSDHPFLTQENVDAELPGVISIGPAGVFAHRGIAAWYPPGRKNWLIYDRNTVGRASMSYVTGSHSFKVGTTVQYGASDRVQDGHQFNSQIIEIYGIPIQAVFNSFPLHAKEPWEKNHILDVGVYAQDQWTLDRLTVNAGLRFDYFAGSYPDHEIPAGTWSAARSFPGDTPATWLDLSPRLGVVYDVRGDGRTAIKATMNRYVSGVGTTLVGNAINPALQNYRDQRTWFDGYTGHPALGIPFGALPSCIPSAADPTASSCIPGDGLAQGDPRNPYPNGELMGMTSNFAFGTLTETAQFDDDWAKGWGQRYANWEFSGGVQHELTDGLSVNATYFRRVYVNYDATNNRLQNAADYDEFCVTVPTHNRLPNGGQQLCGFYDIRPSAYGLLDTVRTSADNFGTRTGHWNGVDLTVNARMDNGLLLQGGLATGRTSGDACDLYANLNNPSGSDGTSRAFCATTEPFLTQVKFLGSYNLPGDIQLAGTVQSIPGIPLQANVLYNAAETTLGRAFTGAASRDLDVLETNSVFGERLLQVDLRFTKIFTMGGGRLRAMLDLYNITNDNTVLKADREFGDTSGGAGQWLRPQALIPGRMLKFAFQMDF